MEPKFKAFQKVAIENFTINGSEVTTWGIVQRYRKNMVEVEINSVFILLPENRLVDFGEFWQIKHRDDKNGT